MKTKICIFLLVLFLSASSKASTLFAPDSDTAALAKLVAQSAAQLKELKEILEINNATLDQVEKANRKVQQTRYRVLRARYLLDSVKTLSHTRVQSTQDALKVMRKSKNSYKEGKSIVKDFEGLTEAEKQKLINDLDLVVEDSKRVEEKIVERKKSILMNYVNLERVSQNEKELQKLEPLVNLNEDTTSGAIDPNSAQIETAKNTALSNKILLNSTQIQQEQLQETMRFHNLVEENHLEKLNEKKHTEEMWEIEGL